MNNSTTVEVTFISTEPTITTSGANSLFGTGVSGSYPADCNFHTHTNNMLRAEFGSSSAMVDVTDDGSKHTVVFNDSEHRLIFDGTVSGVLSGYSAYSNSRPLYFFRINQSNIAVSGYYKVFRASVYNGTGIVLNYIPCYRKSDGEIGVYDTVTNTFKGNSGTGTFGKGADVYHTDRPITPKIFDIPNPYSTPTMTSATTPNGKVTSSSSYSATNYADWKAFDSDLTTLWEANNANTNLTTHWLEYEFDKPITLTNITIKYRSASSGTFSTGFDVKVWDGTDYVVVASLNNATTVDLTVYEFTQEIAPTTTTKVRIQGNGTGTKGFGIIDTIYTGYTLSTYYVYDNLAMGEYEVSNGAITELITVDKIARWLKTFGVINMIPVMTSNTTPYGEASSTTAVASYPAWKAVDGDTTSVTTCAMGQTLDFKYHFAYEVILTGVEIYLLKRGKRYTIETSMDGVNWDVQVTVNDPDIAQASDSEMTYVFEFSEIVRCNYIRVVMPYFQNFTGNPPQIREFKAIGGKA